MSTASTSMDQFSAEYSSEFEVQDLDYNSSSDDSSGSTDMNDDDGKLQIKMVDFQDNHSTFTDSSHKSIPQSFFDRRLEHMVSVDLDFNDLTSLPTEFATKLSNLKTLSLRGNNLLNVPDNLHLISKLETLNLSQNKLSTLQLTLGKMVSLKNLYLQGNKILEIPVGLSSMCSLEDLRLDENKLFDLPQDFGLLTSLKHLDISYNRLRCLSENFGKLQNLETLNLNKNLLKDFPDSFGELSRLKIIDISENSIDSLPNHFKSCLTLTKFHADCNNIAYLPEWVNELKSLLDFSLKSNYVRGEPFTENFGIHVTQLRNFDISGNLIDKLPESFALLSNLEYVDMGSALFEPERRRELRNGNNITALPSSFGINFINIKELRLDENGIEKLPEFFGEMKNLHFLDLYGNNLTEIPDSFCKLGNLKICVLSMNYIRKLPQNFGALKSLEELRIDNNQLNLLPTTFVNLENLKTLDLYANNFEVFPGILRNLPFIDCLDVGLPISEMVVSLNEIEQSKLKRLSTALKSGAEKWHSRKRNDPDLYSLSSSGSTLSSSNPLQSSQSSFENKAFEEENWDDDSFDETKPYANEPVEQRLFKKGIFSFNTTHLFIPSDYHPHKVRRVNRGRKAEKLMGQFEDAE